MVNSGCEVAFAQGRWSDLELFRAQPVEAPTYTGITTPPPALPPTKHLKQAAMTITAPRQPRGSLSLTNISVSIALVMVLTILQPLGTAASKENKISPLQRLKRLTQGQGGSDTTENAAAVSESGSPLFPWMTPAAAGFMNEGGLPDEDSSLGTLFAGILGDEGREDVEGIGSENAMIRSLMSGSMNQNFFKQGLGALGDAMAPAEADIVFEYFPPVALMSSWQSYLTSKKNGDDTVSETEAKQSAAKELVGKLAKMALVGANPDKIMDIVKDFTTTGKTDDPILASLVQDMQETGNPLAIEEIQEKFFQRVMGEEGGGGLTLASFYDTTWLQKVRKDMAGNEAFWEILGEEEGGYFKKKLMLEEEGGGGYVPLKPSEMPDPETLLGRW
ncbi:hypothetical protein VYU27_005821 [Nannochloropsis oceanica]